MGTASTGRNRHPHDKFRGHIGWADQGPYHADSGIVELTGNVQLHFDANARTFRGEAQ
jgi:lipopolysaccharide export system protein LptA